MNKKAVLAALLALLALLCWSCREEFAVLAAWSCDSLNVDSFSMSDFVITLYNDGSYTLSYQSGGVNTQYGDFLPIDLPEGDLITLTADRSTGPAPMPETTWYFRHWNTTIDVVVQLDLAGDGFDDPNASFTRL